MKIEYAKRFIKQFKKAPKQVQLSLKEGIKLFELDKFHPLLNNHALRGKFEGYRSINITGDWRAIFSEVDVNTLYFQELGIHSQLYK